MKLNSIGLLPNFEKDDYSIVRNLLAEKPAKEEVEKAARDFNLGLAKLFYPNSSEAELTQLLGDKLFLLDSARSSFSFLLENLKLAEGSEVLITSFTCVVILNPILWAKLKPVFVDIEEATFNTSIEAILAKVTEQTKLILVQHTFGVPVDMLKLKSELAKLTREDIILVEDLAHTLEATYPNSEVRIGTEADFSLLTFGVEKVISTIRGGGLLIPINSKYSDNKDLLSSLVTSYQKLPELPAKMRKRLLKNPLFWERAIPLYYLGIGKLTLGRILVFFARKFGLLGIQIEPEEYSGGKPSYLPAKMPSEFTILGKNQLQKLPRLNAQRKRLAKIYTENLKGIAFKDDSQILLRYPILLSDKAKRDQLIEQAKAEGFVLGDWYKTMFYTKPEFLKALGYKHGSSKVSESVADRIVNLPTSIQTTETDALRLAQLIKNIVE
jgi:perosamine synthetase